MKKYLVTILSTILLILIITPQINALDISLLNFQIIGKNLLKYEDIEYSTFVGRCGLDWGMGIDVDDQGSAYITGLTRSLKFPTKNPYDSSYNLGGDVFITKLSPSGKKLEYSTFIGGHDIESGTMITVDEKGYSYVCGSSKSKDFPLKHSIQNENNGLSDVFIIKISPTGNDIVYSTLIGGNDEDLARDLALDKNGYIYVTGRTKSKDFPTKNAYDETHNGTWDAFVIKISPEGNELIYSSFIGGENDDWGYGIAVDNNENVYLCGNTSSSDFPIKNAYESIIKDEDVYVMKINISQNKLIYSTYLGGSKGEKGWGLDIDEKGCIYICGRTNSTDFPVINPVQRIKSKGWDAFISKISPNGTSLIYSTFIGGNGEEEEANRITLDQQGCAYSTGYTTSSDFPMMNPFDGKYNGRWDSFVVKLDPSGDKLLYSSYLGGRNNDDGYQVAVDNQGCFYVIGWTESSNFPTKNPCYWRYGGFRDVFIIKFSPIEYTPIQKLKGGFGLSVALNSNKNPINWSISIQGKISASVISNGSIVPYSYNIVRLRQRLGFGKINITISANDYKKFYSAFMLGLFIFNIREL